MRKNPLVIGRWRLRTGSRNANDKRLHRFLEILADFSSPQPSNLGHKVDFFTLTLFSLPPVGGRGGREALQRDSRALAKGLGWGCRSRGLRSLGDGRLVTSPGEAEPKEKGGVWGIGERTLRTRVWTRVEDTG